MVARLSIPRIVVGATGSGCGKTTVSLAIAAALRARGIKVAAFKCGPDYLDPSYHARVLGHTSQNLDSWMMGREAVLATVARAARGSDLAIIEGMMGLFDGATPDSDEGSTAEIAKWLDAPVLLVLDASGIARTVSAIAAGFAGFDRALKVAGLICNRVGGKGHLDLLRAANSETPIVGGLPFEAAVAFPERHLGLMRADEKSVPDGVIERLADLGTRWLDLDAVVALAKSAPPLEVPEREDAGPRATPRCTIAVAYDDAFHFYYEDNLRRLEESGAELVRFSPAFDSEPPRADGIYIGGGYPEALANELSSNRSMLAGIREFATGGGPIYAECGGLMYLCEGIRTIDGRLWPMAGLIAGIAVMRDRLQAIGYVEVETRAPTLIGVAGLRFRGHQFRYSELQQSSIEVERTIKAYHVVSRWTGAAFEEGFAFRNVLGSYVHAHWASNGLAAEGFVESCARFHQSGREDLRVRNFR